MFYSRRLRADAAVGSGEAVVRGEDRADRSGRSRNQREGSREVVLPAGGVDRWPETVPRIEGGVFIGPLRFAERRHD